MSMSPSGTAESASSATSSWRRGGSTAPRGGGRLRDELGEAGREHGAAAVDADDGEVLSCRSLDYLVSDAYERTPDVLAVEDDLVRHVVLPSWPRGTGLKVAAGEASRGGG